MSFLRSLIKLLAVCGVLQLSLSSGFLAHIPIPCHGVDNWTTRLEHRRGRTGQLPESHKKDSYVIATSTSFFGKTGKSSDNWNVAAILRGGGEFNFSSQSYCGSSSLDGAFSGFCPLLWDSLNISWVPKMHHHFIDWTYRAVTRSARLLRRNGKGPARPYINMEG